MEEKIDKGFCIIYSKLSNRRKFIRLIWFVFFCIPYTLMLKWGDISFNFPKDLIYVLLPLVLLIESFRHFKKWKKELV